MSVPVRFRAAVLTLAVCLGLLSLLTLPRLAQAAGSPDLTGEINSPTVLHGERVPVSIRATNPSGGAYGYNVSFRVVLPAGVSYAGGAPVTPTPIAGPGAGETTLIFRNVADISQNATQDLDFEVTYDTSRYDVGDRFTIRAQGFANDNPRWVPRFDAAGLPIGPASDSYTGYTAVLNGVTTINAIDIEKDEPSWEGEILRGVHDHQTTYTLTVRNNGIRRTDAVTVVDYLPAGLEFLGCAGNPDNTTDAPTNTGTRFEYAGAGPIVVGAVSDCLAPSRVETVNLDPDGAGPLPSAVYTRVEWSLGTFASTMTRRISYRAAIPIRENTTNWGGPTPATTGAQAVNLDNNNGPETRDEQELTNYATAGGQYNGAVTVNDEDWLTRTAEDWVVHKETDTPDLVQGALTTWTLTFQTSEYRSVRDAVVTDTVPSGLCPVGAVNYTTQNSGDDSECAPTGANPTQPYRSVRENADGTFTIVWDSSTFPQLAQTNVSQTFTLRFPTITRTRYQSNFNGTTPILTRDEITNRVSTDADQIVRCVAPGSPDCTTPGPEINHDAGYGTGVSIPDASEASELAARPEIEKRVAQSGTDCRLVTYVTTIPTYHPGDRVCWLLHVTFPTGVDTNPQVISDYLPAGTRYELGSDAAYDPPTGRNSVSSTIDETNAADGQLSWTITGRTVPRGSLVFERTISTIVGPSGTTAQNGEVLGNLMKFAARNTEGISEPLRDQRDIVVETPVLRLLKGVSRIDRAGAPVFVAPGANNDHRPVQAGDRVTYRVDVSNTGGQDAEGGEVWDRLPGDYDCLFVSGISNGGTCIDGGVADDRIVWSGLAIAAGASTTLTYTTIVPSDIGASRTITNTAGVRTYAGRTNLNTLYPYFPASNIDTTVDPRDVNAPAAVDPSDVYTNLATVAKSRTTEVNSSADGNDDTQATIGERIDYEVRVTVPAGTTLARDGLLTDVVDSVTRQPYLAGSASLSYSTTAPNTVTLDTSGTTPALRFPAGYAVAPGGPDGVVTLRFSVRVADVAGNSRTAGNLTNRASLTWTDPEEGAKSATSPTVNTQIVEPLIGQSKSDDRNPAKVVPGEIVEYTLTTTNSRAPGRISTAHDVVVVDRVPRGVTPIDAAPGNAPLANGATIPGSTAVWDSAARTITYRIATLAPGATANATLRYRVSVDDPAIGGANLTNTVDTTTASLETGHTGRRTSGTGYAANASDTIQIEGATVTKAVTPGRVTVGEHVDYTLTVSIPADVSLFDVTVKDLLPDNIAFDRFTGSSCVSGACPTVQTYDPVRNGDGTTTVAWDLGDIAAPLSTPAVLRLTYRGHVLARDGASADVVAGDTGVNTVFVGSNQSDRETFDRTTVPPTFQDRSPDARATVTVIEPTVAIDKQVSVDGGAFGDGPATAQSDDTLEYEISIRNTGDAPAYDLTVADTPDAELTDIVLGTPSSGRASIAGGTISWQLDGPLAVGASARLRYTARLIAASNLSDGQSIDNTARLPSYWGVSRAERTDPDNSGIDYREYRGGSDSTRVVLDFPTLTLDKTTGLSGFPDRGRAQVGVSFPWRVTVRNTSTTATARDVVVTDTLPENWGYVAGSATLTPGGASEPTVTANATGDRLAWTVATLAPGASVTIAYAARPTADAATTPGLGADAHVNSALVSSARDEAGNSGNADGPYETPADDARATLQIPALTIAKTPDGGTVTAGGRASFTVLVRNTGAVTATNLVIEDTLPAGMTYRAGEATATPSSGFAESSASGSTIVWTVASLAAGADVSITVPVSVAASVADGTTLTNSASVRSDEQPDPISDDGTLDVSAETNLAIVKDGPTRYTPGEQYTWTLRVTSAGLSDAQNVVVSDPLPAGVTFVSADAPCTFAAGVVRCALGTVAPGFDRTYAVTVRVDPATNDNPLGNTATVATDTTETDPSDNESRHDAGFDPLADVTVEKTVTPSAIARGATATFTLTARNVGPSVAENVALSDRLPAGLTFVSVDSADCSETAGTIDCTFGTLAVGASATVHVVVRGTQLGAFTNRAEVTTTTREPVGGGEPNSDEAIVEVGPVTDLAIVKSGPATVAAGGVVTWQLEVRNDGPDDATGVTVTDRLPAGVTDVSAPAGCTVADGSVRCAVGALANGASTTLEISATVPYALGSATLVNVATVVGDQIEPDPSDNSSEATTTVGPATDLAIVKSGPATVTAGGEIAWTLIATNNGPSTATGVVVTDTLPSGVVLGGATAAQGGCTAAGATLSCALGTLASGASAQITVTATVPAGLQGQTLVNVATIGGSEPDPVPGNNRAEVPTNVTPPPPVAQTFDLALDKQLAPGARAVLGGSFAYTLRVVNAGPAPAEKVVVTDTLPKALKASSAKVPGGSCTIRGQVVRCALGTLAAGASRTATVRVTALRAGSVRNAAVVSASAADRDPSNDRDAVTVRVGSPRATLKLTKRALGRQPVARGGDVRFRATVTNASAVAASDVVVCDALPSGLALRTTGGGRLRGGSLCWQVGLLPARASRTFTFTARVLRDARGTRITNVATATAGNARDVSARATVRLSGSVGVLPDFGRGGGVTG